VAAGLDSRLRYHVFDPKPQAQRTAIYSRNPPDFQWPIIGRTRNAVLSGSLRGPDYRYP